MCGVAIRSWVYSFTRVYLIGQIDTIWNHLTWDTRTQSQTDIRLPIYRYATTWWRANQSHDHWTILSRFYVSALNTMIILILYLLNISNCIPHFFINFFPSSSVFLRVLGIFPIKQWNIANGAVHRSCRCMYESEKERSNKMGWVASKWTVFNYS